nr:unnamed protein product [Trichobilharzia regenti]
MSPRKLDTKGIGVFKQHKAHLMTTAEQGNKDQISEKDPHMLNAVITLQKYIRRFLAYKMVVKMKAQKVLPKVFCYHITTRKFKKHCESEIEKLRQMAYLQSVKAFREEQERKRKLEEEEERQKRLLLLRQKTMLECAFEGRELEMKQLLREVCEENGYNESGCLEIDESIRLRCKMQLIECKDANHNSVLSEACIGGNIDIVQLLLDNGADVNSRGQFGRTPLYRAAFGSHLDIVKILLNHGADPRLYADDGQRPIEVTTDKNIRQLLETWDISETDRLLKQINTYKTHTMQIYEKGEQATLKKLQSNVDAIEKSYHAAQLRVCKAHEELNRRIKEYDHAAANGYENINLLQSLIIDSELTFESRKLEVEKIREKLLQSKLELRNKQDEVKMNNEDNCKPGIHCKIGELDDILFKDIGNRINESDKWPVIIDPSDRVSVFLRHRDTNYVNVLNPNNLDKER